MCVHALFQCFQQNVPYLNSQKKGKKKKESTTHPWTNVQHGVRQSSYCKPNLNRLVSHKEEKNHSIVMKEIMHTKIFQAWYRLCIFWFLMKKAVGSILYESVQTAIPEVAEATSNLVKREQNWIDK